MTSQLVFRCQKMSTMTALLIAGFFFCTPTIGQEVSELGDNLLNPRKRYSQDAYLGESVSEIPKKSKMEIESPDPLFDRLPKNPDELAKIEAATLKWVSQYQKATVSIQVGSGQGSGVVISPNGFVLTAAHVVGKVGDSVTIVFNDGRRHRATVIGTNKGLDSAIVRLDGRGPYEFIPMATNEFTSVGRWVIAVGHPNGYETTRLPVVRLGRVVATTKKTVQSDCSLIPGDSGGPLLDLNGRVVGIHSRIGVSNSLNFHVPIQIYLEDWAELTEGDRRQERKPEPPPQKAFLGIRGRNATSNGCLITEVTPSGPADKAGIKAGDLIVQCDKQKVNTFSALVTALKSKKPDEKVTFVIERDGKKMKLEVTLGATEG